MVILCFGFSDLIFFVFQQPDLFSKWILRLLHMYAIIIQHVVCLNGDIKGALHVKKNK